MRADLSTGTCQPGFELFIWVVLRGDMGNGIICLRSKSGFDIISYWDKNRFRGEMEMKITRINDYETVEHGIERDEPLMAVISFDGSKAYVSHLDDGVEHHILLAKADQSMNDVDKYFRIIFDKEGASWTFVCPSNYKGITDKTRRIAAFYKDGFATISDFLAEFGYLVEITIPKRYQRHMDALKDR